MEQQQLPFFNHSPWSSSAGTPDIDNIIEQSWLSPQDVPGGNVSQRDGVDVDSPLANLPHRIEFSESPPPNEFDFQALFPGQAAVNRMQLSCGSLFDQQNSPRQRTRGVGGVSPSRHNASTVSGHNVPGLNASSRVMQELGGHLQQSVPAHANLNTPTKLGFVSLPDPQNRPQNLQTAITIPQTPTTSYRHKRGAVDAPAHTRTRTPSSLGLARNLCSLKTPETHSNPPPTSDSIPFPQAGLEPHQQRQQDQYLVPRRGSPYSDLELTDGPSVKRPRNGEPAKPASYPQQLAPRPTPSPSSIRYLDPMILHAIDRWIMNNPRDFPRDEHIKTIANLGLASADDRLCKQVRKRFCDKLLQPRRFEDHGYYTWERAPQDVAESPEPHEVKAIVEEPLVPETPLKSPTKKYGCTVTDCKAQFARKGERDKHEKTHEPKIWKCPYCPTFLSRKDKLREHIKTRHRSVSHAEIEDFLKTYHPDKGNDGGTGGSTGSGTARPTQGSGRGSTGGGGSTQGSSGTANSYNSVGSGYTMATTMSQCSDDHEVTEDNHGSKEAERTRRRFQYISLEDREDGNMSQPQHDNLASPRQQSSSEELLCFPFTTVKHLGAGSWGHVDEVKFLKGSRPVRARKVYNMAAKQDLRRRVLREVEIMKRLRHPHVVNLVGLFATSTTFSLILDPVAACDLKQFMHLPSRDERLTESNFSAWFCELASALKYLHSETVSVVHGDLKPANILVKNSHVRIADFGSACHFNSRQKPQPGPFTPIYAAPEAFNGTGWNQAADIFSLGCVYVEMMTVLMQFSLEDFEDARSTPIGNGKRQDSSFHSHLHKVSDWISELRRRSNPKRKFVNKILGWCVEMLKSDPKRRPDATDIAKDVEHSDCSTCSITDGRQDGIHWCAKCTTPNVNRRLAPRYDTDLSTPNPEYCLKTFHQHDDPIERLWVTHQSGRMSHTQDLWTFLERIQQQFPLCPSGYSYVGGLSSFN